MPKTTLRLRALWGWIAGAAVVIGAVSVQAQVLDSAIQTENQITEDAARSQVRINDLSEQARELLSEYRTVVRETESLREYNNQLQKIVDNQRQEIDRIQEQMARLEETKRQVVPFMIDMVEMLDEIVENDIPFRIDERREQVRQLTALLDRADITTSEKFRRVMEAYQNEMKYGRTFAAYEGKLPESNRTVNFIKLGRTLLMYQTLDGEQSGWYVEDANGGGHFEQLPDRFNSPISEALEIAQNRAAPDLVRLPVTGPVKAQ